MGPGWFCEELLQNRDDPAGLWQVAVFGLGVLQQHVTVAAALEELAAAEQGVVAHLRLPDEALQAVHVLNGLQGWRGKYSFTQGPCGRDLPSLMVAEAQSHNMLGNILQYIISIS